MPGDDPLHAQVDAQCSESEALAVARQITMASIALDGWRVWIPPPQRVLATQSAIVRQTVVAAKKAGLRAERDAKLSSRLGVEERCPILLRSDSKRAAVRFDEASAEHVAHHAMMAVKDSETPSVIVTTPRAAKILFGSMELRDAGVGIVARQSRGTPGRIIQMARQIAA